MPFSIRGAILALFVSLLFTSTANAQFILRSHKTAPSILPSFTVNTPSNFSGYFELNTGANWQHDTLVPAFSATTDLQGGLGLPLGVTFGMESNTGLAAELEYTYRNTKLYAEAGGVTLGLGSTETHSVMGNLLYYARTPDLTIEPYIGAGAGWVFADMNLSGVDGTVNAGVKTHHWPE